MFVDTHCHLQYDERGSEELVARAIESGVKTMVCVGTDLEHSQQAIAEAERFENVFATVGLHPHDAKNGLNGIEELISHPKVVGIGECGLDYFYEHSPRDAQMEVFTQQIAWAKSYNKTLVVHTRGAWPETFDLFEKVGIPERTIIHCFTGGAEEAKRCLEFGAYISISGIVTFKKADDIREALPIIPLDRLLIETDSPFLAPVPFRGKQNEPAWVKHVAEYIAQVRNLSIGEISTATTSNAERVFEINS